MSEQLRIPNLNVETWEDYFYRDREYIYKKLGATPFVELVRRPQKGTLDLGKTALAAGVEIIYEEHLDCHGATVVTQNWVLLGKDLDSDNQAIVFGHELGHRYLYDFFKIMPCSLKYNNKNVELFCEYFGLILAYGENNPDIVEKKLQEYSLQPEPKA